MDIFEFQRALDLGLGRAVLHVGDCHATPYREIILDACLHNRAYDPQVEGSRAKYMLDIMRESGDVAFYNEAVIRSLFDEEHDWDTPQRFEIARLLAQSGNSSARDAMYSAFRARKLSAADIATEFIELDGLQGLLFVTGQIGGQLAGNPDQWEDEFLLSVAGGVCGREVVHAALTDASETDGNIKAYVTAVEKKRAFRERARIPDPKTLTYGQLRSLINSEQAGGVLREWAMVASDADLERAAHDLVQEKDDEKLRSLLLLFRKRSFPLEIGHLFELLELPDGPIPFHVLTVLANLNDDRIRSLAFKLAESQSRRGWAIDLLVKNFKEDDHLTIEEWCDSEQDSGTINAFDRSLKDFFAAHPNPEAEMRLLGKMYEKEPCAHCRSYIVERLLEIGGLTDELSHECQYDSYADTRALVNAQTG